MDLLRYINFSKKFNTHTRQDNKMLSFLKIFMVKDKEL